MKSIVLLLIMAFTFLDASASYIRSIRVSSYKTHTIAEHKLEEAQQFLYSHSKMREYQKKYNFHFKILKTKNYYLLVLEPITDRKVVQELLDLLRKKYKSAYPKKLKKLPKETIKAPEKSLKVKQQIKPVIAAQKKKDIEKKILKKQLKKEEPKQELSHQQEKQMIQKITPSSQVAATDREEKRYALTDKTILIVLIAIAFIIVVMLFIVLYLLRQKNVLKNKNEAMLFDLSNKSQKLDAKEKMLSHVSHELRNPIASILGLSQLVLENDLPGFQKENIHNIEQSAETALEIIDDILNISKINAGELRIENKEFNINTMMEHVLSSTYLQAKHNNVEIILEIEDNVPAKIISDSLRLSQVLINLLSNAIKFTQHGNINLKIRKRETRKQSIILEFSVADDGIGMTQEQLEKVFNSYAQAEDSISREFGGTGLGLTISKELVEKMGGTIKVRSQKDVGTTFVFTIEARVFDPENKRNYRLPSKEYLNKSILIVENSNKNVISLLRAFRYFKYKTHVVPSLEGEMFNDSMKYDIIVINQAQINSKSIEKLQKMHFKNRTKTKIILTTYRFTRIDDELIEKLDISGFLKIPFTQQNVLDTLIDMYGAKGIAEPKNLKATKEKLKELSLKKILVAEDNILNHKVLAGLLEKTGAEITFVTNGQEVINLIKKGNSYDLILMDIEMPVINGYDATIEIRKDRANDNIPIIALSANSDSQAKDKAFASGMQGYLTKPISLDEFYKKIYAALSYEIKVNIETDGENEDTESELAPLKELGKLSEDVEFYKSLLQDFHSIYAKSADSLNVLVNEHRYKDAIMLARDIKDVSLNIGAYSLCESVATLEYELEREEYFQILKALQNFEAHLLRLLTEIELYLDEK